MTTFWRTLSQLGTDNLQETELLKKIRLTNQISATLVIICIPFIPIYHFFNLGTFTLAMVIVIGGLVGVLVANFYKLHNLSRIGLITVGNLSTLFFASGLGEVAGNHHFFYAAITGIFVLFNKGELWQKIYSGALPVTGLLYVELMPIDPFVLSMPSNQTLQVINIANILSVTFLIAISQYYLFRENWLSIAQMHKVNKKYKNLTKKLEQRVKERTAELEDANEELSAYNYSISHELRAPLRPIKSLTQILKSQYGNQLPKDAQQIVTEIEKSSGQLMRLIEGLLSFSKTGKGAIVKQEVDMEKLVQTVFESIRPQEDHNYSNIKFNVKELPVMHVDENMFRHVIQNLLSNAIKYSADRNPILITCEGWQSGNKVVFAVHDNGVGFDPAKKDNIFQAFQRLHTERQFEGSGIGLAITQRIVHKHNGTIWAESVLGEGSSFYVSVPIHQNKA